RAAAPDFRLIVVPDHRTGRTPDRQQVPQGGRMEWMAYLHRRGGFEGGVEGRAGGLPPGGTVEPLVFGPQMGGGQIVLRASPEAACGSFAQVGFVGSAKAGQGDPITRPARFVAVTGAAGNGTAPQRLGRSAIVSVTDPCIVTGDAAPAASAVAAG